jgi:hypothetical protein
MITNSLSKPKHLLTNIQIYVKKDLNKSMFITLLVQDFIIFMRFVQYKDATDCHPTDVPFIGVSTWEDGFLRGAPVAFFTDNSPDFTADGTAHV